jgi:hypothetical protein
MSTKKILKRYVESEAAESGAEVESSRSVPDEYEKGSFVVSDDEEENNSESGHIAKNAQMEVEKDAKDLQKMTKMRKKAKKGDKEAVVPVAVHKPQGNKGLSMKHVPAPPEPKTGKKKQSKNADFHYSVTFTNARYAQSFWEVASKALPSLFFHVEVRDDYSGLRLEAYDTPPTMAIKSRMECIIREGVDENGAPQPRLGLNGESFCVNSKSLMKCFKCAQIKDAPLKLTKYHGKDGLFFEALTNEEDVQAKYFLPFIIKVPSNILQKISTVSDVQIRMQTEVLKSLANIGSTVDSPVVRVELFSTNSTDPALTRNKLCFTFPGSGDVHGSHSYYLGTRKKNVNGVDEFEPVAGNEDDEDEETIWKLVSVNAYSNNKFKLFVSNLDIEWCFINLSTDSKPKPMIIIADSIETGANRTSIVIIISPTQEDEE